MKKAYSLNEQCLMFLRDYEVDIPLGTEISNRELVELFEKSSYYDPTVNDYYKTAIKKSIWFAIVRSGNWSMIKKGIYRKDDFNDTHRLKLIKFLSNNLYQVLMLKNQISDRGLKKYHLSAKGIGDDLYLLTESYYRSLNQYKGKHSLSDFISYNAIKLIESNQSLSNKLKFEHMVPQNIYIKPIIEALSKGQLTKELIYNYLIKYYFVCTVTVEEDRKLPMVKMKDDWDGVNPFSRYEEAKIPFKKNTYFR